MATNSRWSLARILSMVLFGALAISAVQAGARQGILQNAESLGPSEKLQSMESGDWLVEKNIRKSQVVTNQGKLVLDNGWVRRTFLLNPNLACIGLEQGTNAQSLLRSIRPEARMTIDGTEHEIGGLKGQAVGNFLREAELNRLTNVPASFQFTTFDEGPIEARFPWKRRSSWTKSKLAWPPPGRHVVLHFRPGRTTGSKSMEGIGIDVHYEIYDGLPLLCKWISLSNQTGRAIRVDRFTSEILACVEASSQVEDLAEPRFPNLHVETDYTSCSMEGSTAQRDSVHWMADPDYPTQVNYKRETNCLLECRPDIGPGVDVASGENFESFRTWILALDSRDEVRQTLSLARMYQTIAPWTAENPLIHHVRNADSPSIKLAIDQSAAVGFEMVIMTFGSGFNIEDESAANIERIRDLAEYAHAKGIALGGYSLLGSRSVSPKDDVVNRETGKPGGFARFGNSPCLESEWGQDYFRKLKKFYELTGCDVLEHDGSYPGDACASENHPGHRDFDDSRWKQWQRIREYYQWCRGQGVYLNVPDWYFLNGSNKTGMGYRETNWSLPRQDQEIIERQNIFDGTKFKTPSMGWMFVPLTEYHGGGPAATIEPLSEHLDHYERRLQNLLGAGVQACFRGPRLYDTDETRDMVKRWVDWYKANRAILDSPMVPLRRADGRDWDGWIHVNPELETPGLAIVYNPLEEPIIRSLKIPCYYTGIRNKVRLNFDKQPSVTVALDSRQFAAVDITLPPKSMITIEINSDE